MGLEFNGRILLLEGIHSNAQERLEKNGFSVEVEAGAIQGKELVAKAKGFGMIGIRSKTQLTKEVIGELPQLQAIGTFCIGTNQVDLEYANGLGVPVFNAPYSNTRSVAELILCEMIMLSRQLGDRSTNAHKGVWTKSAQGSRELRGKVLGIIGYGHIGSQVSVLAENLGLRIIFYDVVKKLALGNAQCVDSLNVLLRESDFVTLHVPETDLTKNMIGKNELSLMKKGAYFLNASRGTVVDIPALATALESGALGGAAVDVFPKEPGNNSEPFASELQGLKNVVLTPHVGGSTEEAQEAIGLEVAESLCKFSNTGSTVGAVGFPNVDVPAMVPEVPRLVNIHQNVPGVLGEINSIISEVGGNIRRQYLMTDPNIGYVVLDMGRGDIIKVAEKVNALSASIKTRVIR